MILTRSECASRPQADIPHGHWSVGLLFNLVIDLLTNYLTGGE